MLVPFDDRAIISASRRTDIPAFYTDWLLNRLRAGWAMVRRPYVRPAEYLRVSLAPARVAGLVFWSKNYAPLLARMDEMLARVPNLYFHFTITGLSGGPEAGGLEAGVPPPEQTVPQLLELSRRFSPEHVNWRFDPICLLDGLDPEAHVERFTRLADRMAGRVARCTISFIQVYAKARRPMMERAGLALVHPPAEAKREMAARLAVLARERGFELVSCCDPDIVMDGVAPASCIDAGLLSRIWDVPGLAAVPRGPTRKECGCFKSVDIGAYGTCGHGCLYCYANEDRERAMRFPALASAGWPALDGPAGEEEPKEMERA